MHMPRLEGNVEKEKWLVGVGGVILADLCRSLLVNFVQWYTWKNFSSAKNVMCPDPVKLTFAHAEDLSITSFPLEHLIADTDILLQIVTVGM